MIEDYHPWYGPLPAPVEPVNEDRVLEFGQFKAIRWTYRGRMKASDKAPYHILTQMNGGKDAPAAALCGTVAIVQQLVTMQEAEFVAGDYRHHTCIDCLVKLDGGFAAHHVAFESRDLVTFDDRKI